MEKIERAIKQALTDTKETALNEKPDSMKGEWWPLDWFITGVIINTAGLKMLNIYIFALGLIISCLAFLKLERNKNDGKAQRTIFFMSGLTLALIFILDFI